MKPNTSKGGKRKRVSVPAASIPDAANIKGIDAKKLIKAMTRYETFRVMVQSFGMRSHDKLRNLLRDGWRQAYGIADYPSGIVRASDAYTMIGYALMKRGYQEQGLELTPKAAGNYDASLLILTDRDEAMRNFSKSSMFKYEEHSEFGKIMINLSNDKEEETMGTQKKAAKKVTKKVVKKVVKKAVKKTAKRPKEGSAETEKDTSPAADAPARSRKDFVADLIIEQKLTDEKIVAKVNAKYKDYPGTEFIPRRVGVLRRDLNAGKRRGFDKPKKALEAV